MEILLIVFGLTGAVWLASLVRHSPKVPDWILPAGLIVLILVECVFGALFFKLEVGPVPVTLDRLLLGGLLGVAIYRSWRDRADSLCISWLDVAVLGWISILVASTFAHDFGFRNNLPVTRLLFFNLLPVAAYFVARHIKWNLHALGAIQWGVLALGSFLAFSGILEWQGWHSMVYPRHTVDPGVSEFLGRARGPLQNPVINGILINAGLAVAMMVAWRVKGASKFFLVWLIPVLLIGSYATLTRSVWVGTAMTFGFLILAPLTWRHRMAVCASGLFLIVAVLGVFSDELNRFKRDRDVSVSQMAESAELRPLLAAVALEMFRDSPIFGHGFGQYSNFKRPYHYTSRSDAPLTRVLPYMQHNVFLSYATESGLVGVIALAGLLGVAICLAFLLCLDRSLTIVVRQHGLLLLCVTGNYLINGMFHDVSIVAMTHSLILILMGMTSSLVARNWPRTCWRITIVQSGSALPDSRAGEAAI